MPNNPGGLGRPAVAAPPGESMDLSESARAVFAVLAAAGTATRPKLAAGAGLSKPTVSSAVAELEAADLAASSGTASGGTGRTAVVYGLGRAAGAVLAVDLGPDRTRVRGCALDGTLLAESTGSRADAADTVRQALDALPPNAPLRSVVVAVGDVTTQDGEGFGERPATAKAGPVFDAMAVALPPGVPVHLENNVNCAALAELHEGAARGRRTFGYLRIGVGIGLGVVIGGQVLRGANGAAGEVARLPYPWDQGREPRYEGLEEHIGVGSLLRRTAETWQDTDGPCPDTAQRLYALAEEGHVTARAVVGRHAAEVGRLAAAVAAVLDPGLIVLGGSVGANPQLVPGVRAELARLSWPTEVVSSALGDSGTVVGASRLAVAHGIQTVTGGVPVKD
jgi:predicted NBD/HSP70 family sugar kinase